MVGRSYMPSHLFQNIQNAQLHKQEDENSSGDSSKKVGTKLKSEAYLQLSQTSTMEIY